MLMYNSFVYFFNMSVTVKDHFTVFTGQKLKKHQGTCITHPKPSEYCNNLYLVHLALNGKHLTANYFATFSKLRDFIHFLLVPTHQTLPRSLDPCRVRRRCHCVPGGPQ